MFSMNKPDTFILKNEKKIKILTVVGTRPELIRISRVISCMDNYFTNILVHTNQNFDKNLNDIFFKDMTIRKPNYFFKNNKKKNFEFLGEIFKKIDKIIKKKSQMVFLFWVIPIVAYLHMLLKETKYQFFILRQEIDLLIRTYQRKSIGKL